MSKSTDNKKNTQKLHIQLNSNTDLPPSRSVPSILTDKDKHPLMSPKIERIKSLNKLDIRSPILSHSITEENSLYRVGSRISMASKVVSAIPQTIMSMRNYYNDFTTIDWADAFIKNNKFQYELHLKHWMDSQSESDNTKIPLYERIYYNLGRWVLIVLIGFAFSLVAYGIDKLEITLVGFKYGYCSSNWLASQVSCCSKLEQSQPLSKNVFKSGYVMNSKVSSSELECIDWITWDSFFKGIDLHKIIPLDFVIYVILTIFLAYIACLITLTTKITGGYPVEENEDLEASDLNLSSSNSTVEQTIPKQKPMELYTAAGSGVPEVKTILSGFVIRRFLGTYTFVAKTIALVLAIASGMSLGKEGPYVHLATATGNILTRFFPFVTENEAIQKQILSASALSGVALAFGSPLGGVLFILEEINHSLPSNQLFQIFFCSIISTLFLKFLDPYGTGNSVLFELSYSSDWKPIELLFFIMIGLAGGIFGAYFVKFVGWWPKNFRSLQFVKGKPVFEVILIALITGLVTFWNPYTKQATAELVLDLATSCDSQLDRSLCPTDGHQFVNVLLSLLFALIVKVVLTSITFGLKLPIGIYVPSMVIGALFGRLFATFIEFLNFTYNWNLLGDGGNVSSMMNMMCGSEKGCVDLGIYAMIGAGAFLAGVTRMNITLVTILFEITGSYTYVLPYSISIAVANWMGNYIESNSLYESLLLANNYPFMSPETEPIDPFKTSGEIIENSVINNDVHDSGTTTPQRSTPLTQFSIPHSIASYENDDKLFIDISKSPYVSNTILKSKLLILANASMLDGCIPLLKNQVCVGLIFFSELEFWLDKIDEFCIQYEIDDEIYCKVHSEDSYHKESFKVPLRRNQSVLKDSIENEQDYFNYGSVDETTQRLELDLQNELKSLNDFTSIVSQNLIFLNYDSELSLAHLVFDKIGNRVIVLLKDGKYYGILHKKTLIDYIRREHS